MNTGFIGRGLLIGIPAALLLAIVGLIFLHYRASIGLPPDPTPPPPTIALPIGSMPTERVSLEEWPTYAGESPSMVGCGFLLQVDADQVIGVTTAHSLRLTDGDSTLQAITFRLPGSRNDIAMFGHLLGTPGRPRTGEDMSVDFALMLPHGEVAPKFVLQPDPRGLPQPGERVALMKCAADSRGQPIVMPGTVQTAAPEGFWVLMDDPVSWGTFNGSGSPFFSQHTGQVVGMLIAGALRGKYALFGAHPIGSLVDLARPRLDARQPELGESTPTRLKPAASVKE